jgi:hypothetical protein
MAYYALINKDDIVVNVITGIDENEIQTDLDGTQVGGSTEAWEKFYESLPHFDGLYCKRTSYNTNGGIHENGGTPFRGNFAGIGYKYHLDFDVFIPPQPFPSWKLSYVTYKWKPPVPRPASIDGHIWKWSELNKEWILVEVENAQPEENQSE